MTRLTNARSAGVTFLVYIAAGISSLALNWYSSVSWLLWLPVLVFELTLSVWFIVKGVAAPLRVQPV